MQIATTEEVAKFMYQRAVAIPQWEKEQSSLKNRFFIEAEKFMDGLNEFGLVIAHTEVVEQNGKPSEEELPFTDPLLVGEEENSNLPWDEVGESAPLTEVEYKSAEELSLPADETHEVPTEESVEEKPKKKRGRGRPKKS